MFDVPTVLTSEEILEKAFRKASKVQVSDRDFRFRMQKLNSAKVDSFASVVDTTLEKYIKAFPSFNNLPAFYIALIDLLYPIDDIRRILGRMDGVRREVRTISTKTVRQITRTTKPDYMDMKRGESFGRISSLVRGLDTDLKHLAEVREGFKRLPSIPTKHPTAVVAGYPSVGKSQLVRSISTATPEVAPYPFTTQELIVGYYEDNRTRYQIVDTPGLLDRPFEERNTIERKAILAITLLTDLCVFMVDPTGHCGYPLEPQVELLASLMTSMPGMRFIVCINKMDLAGPDMDLSGLDDLISRNEERVVEYLTISASTGEGADEVIQAISENLAISEIAPWDDPDLVV